MRLPSLAALQTVMPVVKCDWLTVSDVMDLRLRFATVVKCAMRAFGPSGRLPRPDLISDRLRRDLFVLAGKWAGCFLVSVQPTLGGVVQHITLLSQSPFLIASSNELAGRAPVPSPKLSPHCSEALYGGVHVADSVSASTPVTLLPSQLAPAGSELLMPPPRPRPLLIHGNNAGELGALLRIDADAALIRCMGALCLGMPFDERALFDGKSYLYGWIDGMLASSVTEYNALGHEVVVAFLRTCRSLRLSSLIIGKCYQRHASAVARGYFSALSSVLREAGDPYPCLPVFAFNAALYMAADPEYETRTEAVGLFERLFELQSPDQARTQVVPRHAPFLPTAYEAYQLALARRLAEEHGELGRAILADIIRRLELVSGANIQRLLRCLTPWVATFNLDSMEEHEQSVLNNLLYITARHGTEHSAEMERLWQQLVRNPANIARVIPYLLRTTLQCSTPAFVSVLKRIIVYIGRGNLNRTIEMLVAELVRGITDDHTAEPSVLLGASTRRTASGTPVMRRGRTSVDVGTVARMHEQRTDDDDGAGGEHDGLHRRRSSAATMMCILSSAINWQDDDAFTTDFVAPVQVLFQSGVAEDVAGLADVRESHWAPLGPLPESHASSSVPVSGSRPLYPDELAPLLLIDLVSEHSRAMITEHLAVIVHRIFLGLDHWNPLVYDQYKMLLENLLHVIVIEAPDATSQSSGAAIDCVDYLRTYKVPVGWPAPRRTACAGPPCTGVLTLTRARGCGGRLGRAQGKRMWSYEDVSPGRIHLHSTKHLGALVGRLLKAFAGVGNVRRAAAGPWHRAHCCAASLTRCPAVCACRARTVRSGVGGRIAPRGHEERPGPSRRA